MSILNVEHLTHGFGDRAIFDSLKPFQKQNRYKNKPDD